jgi:hypothetical protein
MFCLLRDDYTNRMSEVNRMAYSSPFLRTISVTADTNHLTFVRRNLKVLPPTYIFSSYKRTEFVSLFMA